jgi:hypothetical protein
MVCGGWRLKKVFFIVINVMVAGGECLEWWGLDSVRKNQWKLMLWNCAAADQFLFSVDEWFLAPLSLCNSISIYSSNEIVWIDLHGFSKFINCQNMKPVSSNFSSFQTLFCAKRLS